jgi:hypothetical protein
MGSNLTDISSVTAPAGGGLLLSVDASATNVDPLLKIYADDVMIDGPSGFDFWIGETVNHCYFGMDADGPSVAPLPATLGYFARGTGGQAHVLMDAWSSGASGANSLLIRRARGTPSSPSGVQSGDQLGTVGFSGVTSAGSQFISANMRAVAAENFGSARGTRLSFSTVLTGASALSERLSFEGSGQAVFGNQVLLAAGAAGAGTAPLKLQSGSLNTTPENGALEFDGTHLYFTIGSTRHQLV